MTSPQAPTSRAPSAVMAFEGSQGHATALASHPQGMPRPHLRAHAVLLQPLRHACQGLGSVPPGALLLAPKGMPACPHKHVMALAACLGLGCYMHAQALAVACPGLNCLPMGVALVLVAACPGQAVGILGACPHACRAASSRIPTKLALAFFHFCVPKFIP